MVEALRDDAFTASSRPAANLAAYAPTRQIAVPLLASEASVRILYRSARVDGSVPPRFRLVALRPEDRAPARDTAGR